jgi:PTH1 family peptidyl-tRNA hydrolase
MGRPAVVQWLFRFFRKKAQKVSVRRLVVGLGNIGSEYEGTRHNIGFAAIRQCEQALEVVQRERCCLSDLVISRLSVGTNVAWACPRTYMNRSGAAVKALLEHLEISPDACLVVVDDYNLPMGRIRFRKAGSDGGHNGLKSIIAAIGEEFPRLRMGIGPMPAGRNVVDFVLSRFTSEERSRVDEMVGRASEASIFFCLNGIERTMSRYNSKS